MLDVCGVVMGGDVGVCEAVATVSACGQRLVVSLDDEHLNMSRQPSDVSTASRM